jgi:hypothetical protein
MTAVETAKLWHFGRPAKPRLVHACLKKGRTLTSGPIRGSLHPLAWLRSADGLI